MIADMSVLMPSAVNERFNRWMKKKNKTAQDRMEAFPDISIEVKTALAELDRKIEAVIDA
jgi:hypothetical protein